MNSANLPAVLRPIDRKPPLNRVNHPVRYAGFIALVVYVGLRMLGAFGWLGLPV
jgi:hypothetical protein